MAQRTAVPLGLKLSYQLMPGVLEPSKTSKENRKEGQSTAAPLGQPPLRKPFTEPGCLATYRVLRQRRAVLAAQTASPVAWAPGTSRTGACSPHCWQTAHMPTSCRTPWPQKWVAAAAATHREQSQACRQGHSLISGSIILDCSRQHMAAASKRQVVHEELPALAVLTKPRSQCCSSCC